MTYEQDRLFNILVNAIELSDLDYNEIKQVTNRALNHIYAKRRNDE